MLSILLSKEGGISHHMADWEGERKAALHTIFVLVSGIFFTSCFSCCSVWLRVVLKREIPWSKIGLGDRRVEDGTWVLWRFLCLGMYIHVAGHFGRVTPRETLGSGGRSSWPLLWSVHIDVRDMLWSLH